MKTSKLRALMAKIKSLFVKKPIPKQSLTGGFVSFSGVDVKVCFDEVPIGTAQGISFNRYIADGKVRLQGTLCFILLDKLHDMLGKEVTVTVIGGNWNGMLSCLFNEKILFCSQEYGLAIDDIVTEEWYTFTGVLDETVSEHQERIKNTTGVFLKGE